MIEYTGLIDGIPDGWHEDDVRNYLMMAYREARYSPDPSTQNGALILHADGEVSKGCNSSPRGVMPHPDRLKRPLKYMMVEHAERSAILSAARTGRSTHGATMFCPWFACADCARAIIGSGIAKVIGHRSMLDRTPEHWNESINVATTMLFEAGVKCYYWEGSVGAEPIRFNGEMFAP